MKAPCGADTYPAQLKAGKIDAIALWEPIVELGAEAIGDNAIIFQNASLYREIYSLYSTTDKLKDPAKRKNIVAFVRALNRTLDVFRNKPETVYDFVGQTTGSDPKVVKTVWPDHQWTGTWGPWLLDYLVDEDKYLQKKDKRAAIPKGDLEKFLDDSIIAEL